MRHSRIDRKSRVIKFLGTISEIEIASEVYEVVLFDRSKLYNLNGHFIDQMDLERLKNGILLRKVYDVHEFYNLIYEGWSFGTNRKPARLICKRKYPQRSGYKPLKRIRIVRKEFMSHD